MTTTTPPISDTMAPSSDRRTRPGPSVGGCRTLPRWSATPRTGWAQLEETVSAPVLDGLRRVAAELAVPPALPVLAAHAVTLAALCGESDVVTGFAAAPGRAPVPLALATDIASWRDLVLAVSAQIAPGPDHDNSADNPDEADPFAPRPQAQFHAEAWRDPCCVDPGPDAVLLVALEGARLVLAHRLDALDEDAVQRIAGYHLAALAQLVTDVDADPRAATLVSPGERHRQLHDLAGPRRPLPDQRVHELFEARAAAHPRAVAAVDGDRTWTYEQLNDHANAVARELLAAGVRAEDVVAVATERNLQWLACVLGVFKAGGAYLPIEPHFPSERIARMLRRSGCTLVLAERVAGAALDAALADLPQVRRRHVDELEVVARSANPGLPVGADQLAYVYFTSGSTGEPKGAMCEHAGLVNHLLAKIEDLRITPDDVVAQTAPQCFDISLWQLVSALVVGARTVIVGQHVVLDLDRFITALAEHRVSVLQVVPSYLEAVLTSLEADSGSTRDLPDLRVVSATGEALKPELVQRWFARHPGVALVNAYGLTETSDDTNHEVMLAPPPDGRVPLGRPVRNVWIYLLDERDRPVPLGAPGAIHFSGVCVGRGYINDPERTAAAYRDDPFRPGQRLYSGGDYGRWTPQGKLEFLGRRDHQVKIAGFRIEIGEIENVLLRVPGVRDGAVVVAGPDDGGERLVAYYSSDRPVSADAVRAHAARSLPAYMVPRVCVWTERLPLTANGKIDRTALVASARALYREPARVPGSADIRPRPAPADTTSPTAQRVRAAWSAVLGVPVDQLDPSDQFFDRGGTSLRAVKLVVALGRIVDLRTIYDKPVLADLVAHIDGLRAPAPSEAPVSRASTPTG